MPLPGETEERPLPNQAEIIAHEEGDEDEDRPALDVAPKDRKLLTQPFDFIVGSLEGQIKDGDLILQDDFQRRRVPVRHHPPFIVGEHLVDGGDVVGAVQVMPPESVVRVTAKGARARIHSLGWHHRPRLRQAGRDHAPSHAANPSASRSGTGRRGSINRSSRRSTAPPPLTSPR